MRGFMAGATSTGLSVASSTAVARSSARPFAIFAIRSAVAGATMTRSLRARGGCGRCPARPRVEELGEDRRRRKRADRQRRDEFCAAAVITASTAAPRSLSRRMRSRLL